MSFQDKEIQRFELQPHVLKEVGGENLKHDFDLIDSYFDDIKGYIYTGIHMSDFKKSIEIAFKSRLLILISSVLNRSLLLKDAVVQALNDSNFPAFYAIDKSFMEIAALLGYIVYVIENENDYQKIMKKLERLYLGNKEAGGFSVGQVEAINVMTMFEKADKVFMAGVPTDHPPGGDRPLSESYANVCNYGHPNYNAHLSSGIMDHKTARWNAKTDSDGYKTELYGFYMPWFAIPISAIKIFCSMIFRHPKVNNFEGLEKHRLF